MLDNLTLAELDALRTRIREALESDSNDMEHDVLSEIADRLGIEWSVE